MELIRFTNTGFRLGIRFGLLLFISLALGCGAGEGKVSGRVLFDGKPLPGGSVTFRPADPLQNNVSAELDGQGNYEAVLPAGEVMVCVDNRQLEPRAPATPEKLPKGLSSDALKAIGADKPDKSAPKPKENVPGKGNGKYVKIPIKYYNTDTSELQFKVERGDQKHDFLLAK